MQDIENANLLDYAVHVNLFDELDSVELIEAVRHLKLVSFNAGEALFREKENGDYACFVVEGEVSVVKQVEGKDVTLATIRKGHSIGEMCLFGPIARSATAVANMNGKLLILTRSEFEDLIDWHPRVGVKLLKRIARSLSLNLRKTSAELAEFLDS